LTCRKVSSPLSSCSLFGTRFRPLVLCTRPFEHFCALHFSPSRSLTSVVNAGPDHPFAPLPTLSVPGLFLVGILRDAQEGLKFPPFPMTVKFGSSSHGCFDPPFSWDHPLGSRSRPLTSAFLELFPKHTTVPLTCKSIIFMASPPNGHPHVCFWTLSSLFGRFLLFL